MFIRIIKTGITYQNLPHKQKHIKMVNCLLKIVTKMSEMKNLS